ncbi:AraC family transcriptional regulator [Catellatospora methionotrophica]|uniref:AraC family transcriptional regulator n=1 Tax=Catellatospora methionotrophica TaxID=121620 RepID=A0A8J3LHM3_9ACTN|nr:AraC family transcriptional regulator [Catellatospora methionotrophica]GIG15336.1 AraC family transcriptional regulator [Catellatospora methionotrophica]
MDSTAERAVKRVISVMETSLDEQLTIDDMAKVAMFSKFHFSRIFQRVTGISPGRFLSALRLQQAKQLLVSTSFNVSDISLRVGYTSVGTFSSRFTRSVGLSPTTYRKQRGITTHIASGGGYTAPDALATVRGVIRPHYGDQRELIFCGLFRDRIPEGRPISCTVLHEPGPYLLEKVPPGMWYLLVHSVPVGSPSLGKAVAADVAVGTHGPLTVRRGAMIDGADIELKPASALDPPVLMALLDVRTAALQRMAARAQAGGQPPRLAEPAAG